MRKSPRQRRLEADYRSVSKLALESSIFSFEASGEVPNRYRLQFNGPGISRDSRGKIHVTQQHEVIVELGASYPRMVPNLLWQTPIFHPNISNNGVVCLGGYGTHWVPSLTLDEMSTMLWDMIRYENFDIESPYNREAALWARHQNHFALPLDKRDIRDLVTSPKTKPAPRCSSSSLAIASAPGKTASGKGMFGMLGLGSLASRFRDRRAEADASAEHGVTKLDEAASINEAVSSQEGEVLRDEPADAAVSADNNVPQEISPEPSEPSGNPQQPPTGEDANESVTVLAQPDEVEVLETSSIVDPSEIEIVEDGITFLDTGDSTGRASSDSQVRSMPTLADDDGSGIVFLD